MKINWKKKESVQGFVHHAIVKGWQVNIREDTLWKTFYLVFFDRFTKTVHFSKSFKSGKTLDEVKAFVSDYFKGNNSLKASAL